MGQTEVFAEYDASPRAVWDVLVDLPSYSAWNPTITEMAGTLEEGASVSLRIDRRGARNLELEAEIVACEPPERLAWAGHLLVPFALNVFYEFHLEPLAAGSRTRLLVREQVYGALTPLYGDRVAVERGLEELCDALGRQLLETGDEIVE